ncbi:MAG: hypothetical protein JXR83_23305 [Deltaproteobacteria bacterium]|nr:hypothetical protein [Deltaproteobacteria bacterium]
MPVNRAGTHHRPRTTTAASDPPRTETGTTSCAAGSATTPAVPRSPAGDGYDASRLPSSIDDAAIPARAGLPDVLFSSANAKVVHGTDPGDYYCEHMFFATQRAAEQPSGNVARNRRGEPMIGFLHVAGDRWTSGGTDYTLAQRHAGTREVIGAAIRGYCDEASRQVTDGPVRVLLTGYDTFMSTTNNPTGEFVSQPENIDAAMREAFGDRLLTPQGEQITAPGAPAPQYRYRVRDAAAGSEREIIVCARKFPVDDTAIDGDSPGCVQKLMSDFKPHAVISMGVTGWSDDKAEFHADSGGLRVGDSLRHDDGAAPTITLADNYSLARAIFLGQRARQGLLGGVIALHNLGSDGR